MEKIGKDKVIRSQKSKVKARAQQWEPFPLSALHRTPNRPLGHFPRPKLSASVWGRWESGGEVSGVGKSGCSIKDDVMVSNAVFAFLEKFFHYDFEKKDQVMNIDLPKYKGKGGDFGRMLATKGRLENNKDGSLEVGGDAVGVDRELHEDDFVSGEEQVEGEEHLELNSNEEGFI
nr:zinc finger, BED-type [Tanacetum cinerariifolium]